MGNEQQSALGRLILVAGMHRSGTSTATRVLSLLGAKLPSNLLPPKKGENETGFWESADLVNLNDSLLQSLGRSWDDIRELPHQEAPATWMAAAREWLQPQLAANAVLVLKDPRLGRLFPFWSKTCLSIGVEPMVVYPYRDPTEVARSLGKRNDMTEAYAHWLWLRYVVEGERSSRASKRHFINYHELLRAPADAAERLALFARLPAPTVQANEAIQQFVEPAHRHHIESFDPSSKALGLPTLVGQAWLALEALQQRPRDKGAQNALDEVRESMLGISQPLEQIWRLDCDHNIKKLRECEQELATSGGHIDGLEAALMHAQEHAGRMERERSEAQFLLQQAQQENTQLEQALAQSNTRAEALERTADRMQADIERKDRVLGALSHQMERLRLHLPQQADDLQPQIRAGSERAVYQRMLSGIRRRRYAASREAISNIPDAILSVLDLNWVTLRHNGQDPLAAIAAYAASENQGWLDPNGAFDKAWYKTRYPDIPDTHSKLLHYLNHGARERRWPGPMFDAVWYSDQAQLALDDNPMLHYLTIGEPEGMRPNPWFDPIWYRARHEDLLGSLSPLAHFRLLGAAAGLSPSPEFDTTWYLARNPDVAAANVNALCHYLHHGRYEGRAPHPDMEAGP